MGHLSGLDFKGLNIKKNGDDFIIEKSDNPNAMPALASEITKRIDADALGYSLSKPSLMSGLDFKERALAEATHLGSHGLHNQRAASGISPSIKRTLLNIAGFKSHAGPLAPPLNAKGKVIGPDDVVDISSGNERFVIVPKDDRPLIDKLHEATFSNDVGMQYFKDKYALRMLLRKAHCFTLDKDTSRLVADFSMAVAHDLESSRRLAIPPFPVTWIEIDNVARLHRIRELGVPLSKTAAGETEAGPPVERVGWLITPGDDGGYNATYVAHLDQGIASAPLSYWWHAGEPMPTPDDHDEGDMVISRLCFGVVESGVSPLDALLCGTRLHGFDVKHGTSVDVLDIMTELGGELRHIWGLLVALGAGQLGVESKTSPQAKPMTTRAMPNGKPLLPLEHKVLHLHLAKRQTVDKVVARAITHHKNREHEVRAHFRLLKKSGRRVPVKSHKRGDEKLGRIEKTYRVER
jgi:hypothetical protein